MGTAPAEQPASTVQSTEQQLGGPALLTVDQLVAVVKQLAALEAWDDLLAYTTTPLEQVDPAERDSAALYLLRMRVNALHWKVPEGERLDERSAPGLRGALDELRRFEPNFHRLPEFEVYLDSLGYSVQETLDSFDCLSKACMEKVNTRWLLLLRDKALRLEDPDDSLDQISEDHRKQLADLPARLTRLETLTHALELAAAAPELSQQERLLVQMLQADVFTRTCDPWDYAKAAGLIRALPGPSLEQLRSMTVADGDIRAGQRLTPAAWGFLWELQNISPEGYSALLAECPQSFGVDLADGVLCILKSVVAGDELERDNYLAQGVELLLAAQDYWSFTVGENLVLVASTGLQTLWSGHLGLNVPRADEIILRLYERTEKEYGRSHELYVLHGVLYGLIASEMMSGPEDDMEVPGLPWLCDQSIAFEMQAACYVPNKALSWSLFLHSLAMHVEAQVPTPFNYFVQSSEGSIVDAEQAMVVLESLEELAEVRQQMLPEHLKMWREEVAKVFQDLIEVKDNDVRQRTLDVARDFEEDLLAKGGAFTLAYLEQVEGDAEAALEHYVRWLAEAEEVESTVSNLKILLNSFKRSSQLDKAVAALQELGIGKHDKEVAALIAHAKARLKPLAEQDQFERTAVNRWPQVTPQARNVLNALANIKRFESWEELGRYAGTDSIWAERHHRKLVSLGMVIESSSGYSINQHIRPLLEQENKHAVVRRIVQGDGTSAVKPVFNSMREHNIYQVMVQLCPNHMVFPNCSLQSIISFDRIKELVSEDDFSYYMRASVDIVVVSTTTYLPMLAIEVDSVWHDTERQQKNDQKKDRLFAASGVPFMRLRQLGSPSPAAVRGQVAEHLDELVRTLRADLPGFEQARQLIEDLAGTPL